MNFHRYKRNFLRLSFSKKLLIIASLITLIGCISPWYSDLDSRLIGATFYGISGPLYLIGWAIFLGAMGTLIINGLPILEKKIPKLPMKESLLYMIFGAESVFLIVIAASIYFNDNFGAGYITSKEPRFGMLFVLIGSGLIAVSGYLLKQEKEGKIYKEEEKKEFIEMPRQAGGIKEDFNHQLEPEVAEILKGRPSSAYFQPSNSVERRDKFNGSKPVKMDL